MVRACRAATALLLCLLFAAFAAPYLPSEAAAHASFAAVVWEDGTRESLSYADALGLLAGGEQDALLFVRDGAVGRTAAPQAYREAYAVLADGEFAEVLSVDLHDLDPFSRLALVRTFGGTSYCADGAFSLTGDRVEETKRNADRVKLFFGTLGKGYLAASGARELVLCGGEISAEDLVGSRVETVDALPPYHVGNGAVYLDTPGGRRLVAGMPLAQTLVLDMAYADMGALRACTALTDLTLPFLGESERRGCALSALFEEIPSSLARLKVTGGEIAEAAFYGVSLDTVDLCGMDPERISESAFDGVRSLRLLIAPRSDLLEGYNTETLPCGCTEYRK